MSGCRTPVRAKNIDTAARLLPALAWLLGCGPPASETVDSQAVSDTAPLAIDTSVRPQPAGVPWEVARRRGVDFRAIGQEPGWLLEIDDEKQIYLLADYGEKKVTVPFTPPQRNADGTVSYDASSATRRLTILIRELVCHDVMSGEEMTHTVTVTLDSTAYHGCGRDLRRR